MKFKKRNIQIVDHSTGQTLDFPTFGKQAGEEAINELEQNVDNKIAELKSLVGTPLKASTASAMNNRDKIYVYTGNETGYTNGHWYYYDGTNWADGGVYNSTAVETDKTLSVENVPADAKKTGDEINKLKSALDPLSWIREFTAATAPNAYNIPDSAVSIGDKFTAINATSGTIEVRFVAADNTALQTNTVYANTTRDNIVSEVDADHIRCYFYQNGKLTLINTKKIVPTLQHDVSEIQADIEVDKENILNPVSGSYIALNGATADIENPVQNNVFASQVVAVKAGDVFYVTGFGGNKPRLYGWVADDGAVNYADYQDVSRSNYKIVAPIDGYLVYNFNMSHEHALYRAAPIAKDMIYRDDKIWADIALDTITDVTNADPNDSGVDLSGTYADITDIERFSGFSLQIIEAKKGQTYYITGSGGNKSRVYGCISKTGYIFKRAVQDTQLTDYELEITEDCYLVLHFHRGYPMSVKVKDIVNESIPRIKDDITEIDFKQIRYLYPFGHGISGKYDTPDMPALTGITQNDPEKLTFFYGLYDGLVSDYPNYVSKVDCDTEVQSKGITRPAYMEGYPIYLYQFKPPFTRGSDEANAPSVQDKIKIFITTGTHPEYVSIYDCFQTMKLICDEWENDENLEALRWGVEFYVMPCSGSWGVENFSRPNYNGVDLNRNVGTKDWKYGGYGTIEYSGPSPNSEYETKVFNYYLDKIKPLFYIDHHNFTWSADLWYGSSRQQKGVDILAIHMSHMTRRVKKEYPSIFPPLDNNVIFGFSQITVPTGTRVTMGAEKGALSTLFETCESIGYNDGVLQNAPIESWSARVVTIATDAFLNYILRLLMTWT